ncbi:MAG: Hsp20/alpha crystallin family protein [Steroidobacteraceae bacterium]
MRSIDRIAWMWDEALHALERAERRHRQFYGLAAARSAAVSHSAEPLWEPPVDVFESESEIVVCIALPGVPANAVTVQIAATGLLVSADRPLPAELATMRIRRLEIPYGRFERHLDLTSGRYALVERLMADGCLTLRLAKE